MLDRVRLLQAFAGISSRLFRDFSLEYNEARVVWMRIAADPLFFSKIMNAESPWPLPLWNGKLDAVIPVDYRSLKRYRVISVDGSQVFPDKHQGTDCFLINTGTAELTYGIADNPVFFMSNPRVFSTQDNELLGESPVDLVSCRRQEFELYDGFKRSSLLCKQETKKEGSSLLLFDGSIIFWHLNAYGASTKQFFLERYLKIVQQLYELKMFIASYISLPKSKDLVNLVRIALSNFNKINYAEAERVDHVVDANILSFYLQPYTRSIVFKSGAAIASEYPPHLHPHFFYLHGGNEICRVELPGWMAFDTDAVDMVARIVLDQVVKGNGYPVVIAEAHEQAVIKGPDRDFFYHLIAKVAMEQRRRIIPSRKIIKKRGIGI